MSRSVAHTLDDPTLFVERNLIDGEWCQASDGRIIEVDDPATGSIIGTVPNCAEAETQAAISAAEAALPDWSAKSSAERSSVLLSWRDLVLANRRDLARIITLEQGKPLAEADGEIAYAASFIGWFAEEAKRIRGESIPATTPDRRIFVFREPIGVCAAITPWNFPSAMITRKVAPALAAGCSVVVKPSELTPYSALSLGLLAQRVGIPNGVLNIVSGEPRPIGNAITTSPAVRLITFTGSTRVGHLLMEQSAPTVKKLSLELGGNAPLIVFDDADVDLAVRETIVSKFRNGGQTCVCANRIYAQSGVYSEFANKLTRAVSSLRVGNGMLEGVHIGPMINDAAVTKIEEHVSDALLKGANLLAGTDTRHPGTRFFEPTVVADATREMQIFGEETFGPVAALFPFETEEDVIRDANDTPYGLAAYLFTRDLSRSFRISRAMEAGVVSLNIGGFANEVAPFGGIKQSGIGREGSHHGIEEFLELKTLHVGGLT